MQWTKEKAWKWHEENPWIRGCNYIGSDCANRRDMWQSYHCEEHLATADREFALCEKIGFNAIRILLDFDVWYQEPEHFMHMVDSYLTLCAKHHLRVILCLANEVELPRGIDEPFVPKKLGEQVYALGYHQGRFPLTEEQKSKAPYHFLERAELKDCFLEMIRAVVCAHMNDERVLCWNVYNEPGITIGDRCKPLLQLLFNTVRALNPSQPLMADVWHWRLKDGDLSEEDQFVVSLSDVISFHYYGAMTKTVEYINAIKKFDRPMICTEWLNRMKHNDVHEIYPLFFLEKIGCFCWGFVVGKTQTNEPWDSLWEQYDQDHNLDCDFTKWQHDLFRANLRPYDPKEIEIIEFMNGLANRK